MSAKKIVVKVDLHDDRDKRKALKAVAKILHIDSIAMDTKDMKLTVVGDIDPVDVVNRLRRYWNTTVVNIGPAKEPEKKKDDKKDDKKDEKKDDKTKDDGKKDNKYLMPYYPHMMPYYQYPMYTPQQNYPQQVATHYPPMSAPYAVQEETPGTCVIS